MIPRGIRNNNPGNLRACPANNWQGKLAGSQKKDKAFEEFSTLQYGYRALLITLRTYIRKYQLRTLRQVITRWAPPTENDTESYIKQVANYTGLPLTTHLRHDDKETLCQLAYAISRVENGQYVGTYQEVQEAWQMI